jgi:hypothetical protein
MHDSTSCAQAETTPSPCHPRRQPMVNGKPHAPPVKGTVGPWRLMAMVQREGQHSTTTWSSNKAYRGCFSRWHISGGFAGTTVSIRGVDRSTAHGSCRSSGAPLCRGYFARRWLLVAVHGETDHGILSACSSQEARGGGSFQTSTAVSLMVVV